MTNETNANAKPAPLSCGNCAGGLSEDHGVDGIRLVCLACDVRVAGPFLDRDDVPAYAAASLEVEAATTVLAALTATSPALVLARSTPAAWIYERLARGFDGVSASYELPGGGSFADLSIRVDRRGRVEAEVSFWSGKTFGADSRAERAAATAEIFAIAAIVETAVCS